MPNDRLKAKPVMIYIPENEKKLFQKHARKNRISLSKWIKGAALAYLNNTMQAPVDDSDLVDGLKQEIIELRQEIIQLKAVPSQGIPDRMADQIFEHLKSVGKYVSEDKLHDLFNISTQEEHDDFTVAMHQLQFHHASEIEYSGRYGWRWKK